ncbi:MAG: Maf family protein [Chloroflexota bacterium]
MTLNKDLIPMLFLASGSPRRKQLLSLLGWNFQVYPVQLDESLNTNEMPQPYVLRLAANKASSALRKLGAENNHSESQVIVIAADTAVIDGRDVLGKPVDEAAAVCMLSRLKARVHQVYTGVAVASFGDESPFQEEMALSMITDVCVTDVVMRNYNDEDMLNYIASRDPLDKAGGYAIQHQQFHPVDSIKGCYSNVVGMPICHLRYRLSETGIENDTTPGQILACCQQFSVEGLLREDCCRTIWEQFGWL